MASREITTAATVTQLSPTIGQGNTGNTRSSSGEDASQIDKKKELLRNALAKNADIYSIFTGNKLEWIRDKYDILGTGVYGMVVKYNLPEGPVAVKFIEDFSSEDNKEPYELSDTTLQEIGMLIALYEGYTREGKPIGYPNVLSPVDVFHIENITGIVFPLASKDLSDLLTDGSLDKLSKKKEENLRVRDIILEDIALQILKAIIYIESRDILNGDYKIENILLFDTGKKRIFKVGKDKITYPCYRAVVADFSLSITNKCYNYETGGTTFFSAVYKPPELIYGDKYTPKADVWAFGVILYYLFVGEFPFDGETSYKTAEKESDEESEVNKYKGEIEDILAKLGQPNEKIWPGVTKLKYYNTIDKTIKKIKGNEDAMYRKIRNKKLITLLKNIFVLNPTSRIDINQVIDSDFFGGAIERQNTQKCLNTPSVEIPSTCVDLLEVRSFLPKPDAWNRHKENRDDIIYSAYSLLNDLGASPRVYILAVKILEDFLSKKQEGDVNNYIGACIHIASLTAEVEVYNKEGKRIGSPISVGEIEEKLGIDIDEFYRDEWKVLSNMKVDIYRSTSMDFILTYTQFMTKEERNIIFSWCKLLYFIPHTDNYSEEVIALVATILGLSYNDISPPDIVRKGIQEKEESVTNFLIFVMEYCKYTFFSGGKIKDNGDKLNIIYHGKIILDNTPLLKQIVEDG